MKNLHKKIVVVALSGLMLLGGSLSQGLVANAISISSSGKNNNMGYEDFENYIAVKSYGEKYRYEAEFLKKGDEAQVSYSHRWDFEKKVKNGDLEKYRKIQESIIIKVGKSKFKLFFYMPKEQRDRIIVNECSKKSGFNILYSSRSSVEVGAWIRSNFKQKPNIMKKLLKEPSKSRGNLFEYGSSFRVALDSGEIRFESGGYYRFRVGSRDYVIYKR